MIKGGIVNKYSSKVRIYYQHRMCRSLLPLTLLFYFYSYYVYIKKETGKVCSSSTLLHFSGPYLVLVLVVNYI